MFTLQQGSENTAKSKQPRAQGHKGNNIQTQKCSYSSINVWGCFIDMFMKIYEQNVDNISMLELIYNQIFNKPGEILIKLMYDSVWAMFENVQMVIL